jgi:D-sedoheptulose 7-phosphate isomerase
LTLHTYIEQYLRETIDIAQTIDRTALAQAAVILGELRDRGKGRLFILGVGGSAGNASHATNDFRKIGNIETYCPSDNVSELTAWTNDVGWDVTYSSWLTTSRLTSDDVVLVFSVGGGSSTTSQNLVCAMELARERSAKIVSIVSRDGGRAKMLSTVTILVPVVEEARITPHAEGWQAIVWHLLVNAIGEIETRPEGESAAAQN